MPVGSLSLYAENEVLEHAVGKAGIYARVDVFVALFTVAPTDEDGTGGTEASLGNYARKSTVAGDWNNAVAGHIDNANAITFVECAGANWGNIKAFAIYTLLAGGNMIAWGHVTTPKDIDIGDTAKFAAGEIDITLD